MKFSEIISRVTGLSVPVFGIQWNPPETERAAARRIISHLEDRRVLFTPSEMEVPYHCVESVLNIRSFLTDELGKIDGKKELALSLKAMRAACRKFLSTVQESDRPIIRYGADPSHYASWVFNGAVGELRGVFGIHIARIAATHGLDVEDDLASILPAKDEEALAMEE